MSRTENGHVAENLGRVFPPMAMSEAVRVALYSATVWASSPLSSAMLAAVTSAAVPHWPWRLAPGPHALVPEFVITRFNYSL